MESERSTEGTKETKTKEEVWASLSLHFFFSSIIFSPFGFFLFHRRTRGVPSFCGEPSVDKVARDPKFRPDRTIESIFPGALFRRASSISSADRKTCAGLSSKAHLTSAARAPLCIFGSRTDLKNLIDVSLVRASSTSSSRFLLHRLYN